MTQLFKMAFRNMGRNRRRSFFLALALAIGLALLMLMAAVVEGEMRGSLDLSIRLAGGRLQVRSAAYNENKTSLAYEDLVEDPGLIAEQIGGLPQVKVATPRFFASGILASVMNRWVCVLRASTRLPAQMPPFRQACFMVSTFRQTIVKVFSSDNRRRPNLD